MFSKFLVKLFVFIVRSYQICVSPFFFAPCCRFFPSCSEYAILSIKLYGPLKGSLMGIRRIMRCHPLHPGGYDPVK